MSSQPSFSISQISTLPASFDEDLAAYAAAGLDGIGIWEMKLPEGGDAESSALVRASGLEARSRAGDPVDPAAAAARRADRPAGAARGPCASIHRLAAFEPQSIVCLTGPRAGSTPAGRAGSSIDGLRTLAARPRRPACGSRSSPTSARAEDGRSRPRSPRRSS